MADDNDNEGLQLSPEQAEELEQLLEADGGETDEDSDAYATDSDDDWDLI